MRPVYSGSTSAKLSWNKPDGDFEEFQIKVFERGYVRGWSDITDPTHIKLSPPGYQNTGEIYGLSPAQDIKFKVFTISNEAISEPTEVVLHTGMRSINAVLPKHILFKVLYFILVEFTNYTLLILFSVKFFKNTLL